MPHLAGKAGAVYVATAIIDDCEDAWTSGTHGTASLEATTLKVGTGACKIVGSSVTSGDVLAYEAIAAGATDYSGYDFVYCWARCTDTVAAADLRLVLDSDAGAPAAPETLLDFPALTANTWKYCRLTGVGGSLLSASTAALTVGLEYNANAADNTIYLDDIRAGKDILGIKSWTLDYTSDALETTDFADSGTRSYIIGASGWSGSFEGYKDGVPLSIGTIWGIELAESATATQTFAGSIIITGVHANAAFDGVVSYSYDFQGTMELRVASA